MSKYARNLAVFLAGMALWSAAFGCSCSYREPAGFIHAGVERLPSNARGALFLAPWGSLHAIESNDDFAIFSGTPPVLSASDFVITLDGDDDDESLPVQIVRLDLQGPAGMAPTQRSVRFAHAEDEARYLKNHSPIDWQAMLKAGTLVDVTAAVVASQRLARIGPVGGFKPGARYTITYTGPHEDWSYPAEVVHTIDRMPLQIGDAQYGLALDGAPRRRPLPDGSGGSTCSFMQLATVQDFHYVLPAGQQRYAGAMAYFSEFRTEAEKPNGAGGFESLEYRPHSCAVPGYGTTARGNGAEFIAASCQAGEWRAGIRGWAGLLEVEDRLRPTAIAQVEFASATGSCTAFGMLKQAMASGDASSIEETACAARMARGPTPDEVPSMAALMSLATSGSEGGRFCAKKVIGQLFIALPAQRAGYLEAYGELLATDFLSPRSDLAYQAKSTLDELLRGLTDAPGRPLESTPSTQALLQPLLRTLLQTLHGGSAAQSQQAGEQIASFGKWATPLVPELLALAGTQAGNARHAAHALTKIIPDNPALHEILLRQAGDPLMREAATLDYDAVAGKVHEEKAIGLLVEAARARSDVVFDALGRHGRAARSSTALLISMMNRDGGARYNAVKVLLVVADGEADVLAAFAVALNTPGMEMTDFQVASLAVLAQKNRALLPAIEQRMQRPMSVRRQAGLEALIRSMALPEAQTGILLERLSRVSLGKESYSQ